MLYQYKLNICLNFIIKFVLLYLCKKVIYCVTYHIFNVLQLIPMIDQTYITTHYWSNIIRPILSQTH